MLAKCSAIINFCFKVSIIRFRNPEILNIAILYLLRC